MGLSFRKCTFFFHTYFKEKNRNKTRKPRILSIFYVFAQKPLLHAEKLNYKAKPHALCGFLEKVCQNYHRNVKLPTYKSLIPDLCTPGSPNLRHMIQTNQTRTLLYNWWGDSICDMLVFYILATREESQIYWILKPLPHHQIWVLETLLDSKIPTP